VGLAAAPFLRAASRTDPNPTVRARSAALLGELGRRRR